LAFIRQLAEWIGITLIFMSLYNQINEDLKSAMKAKDELALSVLRMLISSIKNKKIELKKQEDLSDDEIIAVLKSEVKKRRDSIESYQAGGRDDLVQKEQAEIDFIQKYLPEEMSEEQVVEIVQSVIDEIKPAGPQDFGKVMGAVMGKLKGQADGAVVQRVVKEKMATLNA
jgi:uncharacterized protein YqeY